MSFFTVISQVMKFSWRKIINETCSLLIQPWKFKHGSWVLESKCSFIHLTDTVLATGRLITKWLSTFLSKWKFHEYPAVTADVNSLTERFRIYYVHVSHFLLQIVFTLLIWTGGIVVVEALWCLDQYLLQNSSLLSVLINFDKVQIFIWNK